METTGITGAKTRGSGLVSSLDNWEMNHQKNAAKQMGFRV